MNLISANSRLFRQAELRLSTIMKNCTAMKYTLTKYEFLIKCFLKKTWKQPRIIHIFSHSVNFLGHIIEGNTIILLKSFKDAIIKPQPLSNKNKIPEFLGTLNFLCKYVFKMQLYLRPFYNILRQEKNFEWTIEHQKRFDGIKTNLTEQISNTIPDPDHPIYSMCDASNFGIGAALSQRNK